MILTQPKFNKQEKYSFDPETGEVLFYFGKRPDEVQSPLTKLPYLTAVNNNNNNINDLIKSGSIKIDRTDTQIHLNPYREPCKTNSTRSKITRFSTKSRNRLLYKARNMDELKGFNTLTYHENWTELTGAHCKRHWDILNKRIVRKHPSMYGLWFFEFQQRGAPHFHFFSSTPICETWLKNAWNDIVDHENKIHRKHGANAQTLIKRNAAAGYASKYSAKQIQKAVPDGFQDIGRFWGTFGLRDRNNTEVSMVGNKDFFDLIRMLRKANRKHVESYGGKWKKHGHGIVGFTAWDCSKVASQFIQSIYKLTDPPEKINITWGQSKASWEYKKPWVPILDNY